MKKKLLSLLMAGAMVASTSVNAFATDKVINGSETAEHETNISITGDVENNQGEVKPGNLHVTVPTAAAFTVTKEGNFNTAPITITNGGTQSIDVYAHAFTDVTADSGITIVKESEADSNANRTKLSLKINGNNGTAYLGSNPGTYKEGIYNDAELSSPVQSSVNPIKLSVVGANGGTDSLILTGKVGSAEEEIENPVQDKFTLVLKIKKTDK